MMFSHSKTERNIKNVKYFDDLKITAAFHRKFPCEIIHRKTPLRQGAYSLELILNGDAVLYLDDQKYLLKAPSIFWLGDHHQTFQFELIPGECYDHYWVDFFGERGRKIYESLTDAFSEPFLPLHSVKTIHQIFEYFSNEFKLAKTPASKGEEVLMLEQLIIEIMKQTNLSGRADVDPYRIEELAEWIEKSPFEQYDLKKLAEERNLSYIHFRTLFKKRTGESIRQYILSRQMLAAGDLLKKREFRIGELADYCGFPDISSFTRAFKRYYGTSPKHWLQSENEKALHFQI